MSVQMVRYSNCELPSLHGLMIEAEEEGTDIVEEDVR